MPKLIGGILKMRKLIMLVAAGFILHMAAVPALAAVGESAASPEFKAELKAEVQKLQQEVSGGAPFAVATVPQRTPVRMAYMGEYLKGMTAYQEGNYNEALEHLTAADAIIQDASRHIQVK